MTAIVGLSVGFAVAGELVLDSPTHLLRFDGSVASAIASTSGASTGAGQILAIAAKSGVLCIGGEFSAVNAVAANSVACLENGSWSGRGSGLLGQVRSLAFRGEDLVAGGKFVAPGGANLAVFDVTGWNAVGGGVESNAQVDVVAVHLGAIYAGGTFTTPARYLARFDGSWESMPSEVETMGATITDIAVVNGDVYVAGGFSRIGSNSVAGVAKWSNSDVSALVDTGDNPLGVSGDVRAVAWDGADLIVAGNSLGTRFSPANNVLRLRNGEWHGVGDLDAAVNVLHRSPSGDIFAGTETGGLFKLSSAGWEQLAMLDGAINAIIDAESGLLVGGAFSARVTQLTSSGFAMIGASGLEPVRALHLSPDGKVCAGVDLSTSGMSSENLTPLWCRADTQWVSDQGVRGSLITSIASTSAGTLWVAGSLWIDHPVVAASYDGHWTAFDLPLASAPANVVAYGEGVAIAGSDRVHYWDGTDVTRLLDARGSVSAIAFSEDTIVVGGSAVFGSSLGAAAGVAILDLQHE